LYNVSVLEVLCFLWLSYFIDFKLQRPFQEYRGFTNASKIF